MCQALNKRHSCHFYNNLQNKIGEIVTSFESQPQDIEDLTRVGKEQEVCPFFLSKQLQEIASVTFLPYNYLIDSKVRNNTPLKADGKKYIVVFDEAHNLEQNCSDAASFEITSVQIARSNIYIYKYQERERERFDFHMNL